MQAILNLLLDRKVQRKNAHHHYRFDDYAEALVELWPEIRKLRGLRKLTEDDLQCAEIIGCGANALVFSLPGTTCALKITGAEWDEETWGRRKFDAKIFWRREASNGVTIYLQQGGDSDVSELDARLFAKKLEHRGWDCWDGMDNVEIDMHAQLLYVHDEDVELDRGVKIGERYVILIDPDAVCKFGKLHTETDCWRQLEATERRQARNPDECWD